MFHSKFTRPLHWIATVAASERRAPYCNFTNDRRSVRPEERWRLARRQPSAVWQTHGHTNRTGILKLAQLIDRRLRLGDAKVRP